MTTELAEREQEALVTEGVEVVGSERPRLDILVTRLDPRLVQEALAGNEYLAGMFSSSFGVGRVPRGAESF